MPFLLLFLLSAFLGEIQPQATLFRCENGRVNIRSEAPLELIQANSRKLRGLLNPADQTFAWSLEIKTLHGFNNPLQEEHFNENYMETGRFPTATFTGKIIETVDLSRDGTYPVRAKGQLTVHGVTQERILKSELTVRGGQISVNSKFTLVLADHHITIPRVVFQKIAEEVTVTVEANLTK